MFRKLPDNFLLMRPDATIADNTDGHVAVGLKPRTEAVGRALFDTYPSVDQNKGGKIFQSPENVRHTLRPDVMPLIRYDLKRPAAQGDGFGESYWQATHYPILADDGQLEYIRQRTQNVTALHRPALHAAEIQRAFDESNRRTRFIPESLLVTVWTNRPDRACARHSGGSGPHRLLHFHLPANLRSWGTRRYRRVCVQSHRLDFGPQGPRKKCVAGAPFPALVRCLQAPPALTLFIHSALLPPHGIN
ncbi:hypothetical protein AXW84_14520 [Hymenobacter sp. PAMC 26628]|nr:hypothetical protein AXW84_14520 [Hymenobacter sp. PAMC 26628]